MLPFLFGRLEKLPPFAYLCNTLIDRIQASSETQLLMLTDDSSIDGEHDADVNKPGNISYDNNSGAGTVIGPLLFIPELG